MIDIFAVFRKIKTPTTMTKNIKHILKGVGSVMDIAPSSDYSHFIPKETPSERMRGHWERTGNHLTRAVKRFADEQEKKN